MEEDGVFEGKEVYMSNDKKKHTKKNTKHITKAKAHRENQGGNANG